MVMVLPTGLAGRLLAAALTLVGLGLLWAGLVMPLVGLYGDRADALAREQSRLAAMERLISHREEWRARAASGAPPPQLLVEGTTDAVAAATLQNQVQTLATSIGATLNSVENLPAAAAGPYRRIGLRLALDVPWPVLVEFLTRLETSTPPLLLDDLAIHASPVPVGPGAGTVAASVSLYAFRSGEGGS